MDEKPGRSFELWLLALGLLFVALAGWLRVQFVLSAWDFLTQAGISPGPVYQAVMGGGWGLAGLVCAVGLLARRRWAPVVTRLSVVLLAAWYWADYLLFTQAPDARDNWPYMLGITALALFFTFGILALSRQKQYFEG